MLGAVVSNAPFCRFCPGPGVSFLSSVTQFMMYLVMTGPAERHQVACLMCSTSAYRNDVMHLIRHHHLSFLEALFTIRVHGEVSFPYLPPMLSVLLLYLRLAGIIVVLFVCQLLMLLTVLTPWHRTVRTISIGTSSSW